MFHDLDACVLFCVWSTMGDSIAEVLAGLIVIECRYLLMHSVNRIMKFHRARYGLESQMNSRKLANDIAASKILAEGDKGSVKTYEKTRNVNVLNLKWRCFSIVGSTV